MEFDEYYMNIAIAVRKKANCKGRRVGAIIVKENRVISTGYNGTPEDFQNCLDGGCVRCSKRGDYGRQHYDICICVHAEKTRLLRLRALVSLLRAQRSIRRFGHVLVARRKSCKVGSVLDLVLRWRQYLVEKYELKN